MDGNEASLTQKENTTVFSNTSQESDPEQVAASMFALYLPRFQTMVGKLSNKALRRVLKALVEYPLVEEEYHFSSDLEKDTFFIAEQLILSKLMMVQHVMLNNTEALQVAETSVNTEVVEKSDNEVTQNG